MVVACASQQGDSGIQPTKIISPSGEILAHTAEDGECAFAEIDLNKNDYICWLSVGGANSNPKERFMKMNVVMICMGICNKKARIFCLLAKR